MKKNSLLVLLVLLVVVLAGCQCKSGNANGTTLGSFATNKPGPFFVVETVKASKGNNDTVLRVFLKNNPGFLTMDVCIAYDSMDMSLTKVINGVDYPEYNFVGPKNMQSNCSASWFIPEMPENIVDGNILELHFSIQEQAENGAHPVSISCSEGGGIVNQNKEVIVVNSATGYIEIN